MAGTDLLGIATSGLFGAQNGLNVTSNNIANVNNPSYSRQQAQFDARLPIFFGGSFLGTGVETTDIRRIFDRIATMEVQSNTSNSSQQSTFLELASQIDGMLADPSAGASPAIQSFFDSVQGLTTDPASISQREVVFNQINILSARFNSLSSSLDAIGTRTESEISALATQVSTLGSNIAVLNKDIAAASAQGKPNALLDKRDELLRQLSDLVSVSSFEQQDGSLNVFIGNGQSLVIGTSANTVTTAQSSEDPTRFDLVLVSGAAQSNITGSVSGGRLGALLDFRSNMLEPTYNRLGKVAMALSDRFNQQNAKGMDLNNQLGGLLFNDINATTTQVARVLPNAANTGTVAAQVAITDVNNLSDDNYRLSYSGGTNTYTLFNQRTNAVETSFLAPGTVPTTISNPALVALGFNITFTSGAPANGDSFIIKPSHNGAQKMGRAVADLSQIAAASPLRLTESSNNTGTGSFVSSVVTDSSNPAFSTTPGQLTPPVRIVFTSATTYNIVNDTTNGVIEAGLVYTPNQQNQVLPGTIPASTFGYQITLQGAPQTGDRFVIGYNSGGSGDNRNSLLFAGLQTQSTMEKGSANFQQSYGQMVARVGVRTQEAKVNSAAATSSLRQAQNRRDSASGVNLDEEAANLIKFQQAYQASARVVSVASTLFDTLIASLR